MEQENEGIVQKVSRADLVYTPLCKPLKDVMLPNSAYFEGKDLLLQILKNYE
jgi:hypothetical protein